MPIRYRVLRRLKRLWNDRRAVTSLEYGIIAAAVVVVGLASAANIGTKVSTKMTSVKAALN